MCSGIPSCVLPTNTKLVCRLAQDQSHGWIGWEKQTLVQKTTSRIFYRNGYLGTWQVMLLKSGAQATLLTNNSKGTH